MRIAQLALIIVTTIGCFQHGRAAFAQDDDAPPQAVAAESITGPAACRERLDARHVTFSFTRPVIDGDCSIPLPVRLRALAVDSEDIPFSGEPTLDCRMAERLADWIATSWRRWRGII